MIVYPMTEELFYGLLVFLRLDSVDKSNQQQFLPRPALTQGSGQRLCTVQAWLNVLEAKPPPLTANAERGLV